MFFATLTLFFSNFLVAHSIFLVDVSPNDQLLTVLQSTSLKAYSSSEGLYLDLFL